MKQFLVTKRVTSIDENELQNLSTEELENPEKSGDSDSFEKFTIVKIRDGKRDITSRVDSTIEFEGNDELAEYLGVLFNTDPEKIEIIEEESTIEIH